MDHGNVPTVTLESVDPMSVFRTKYGLPADADPETRRIWLSTPLPRSQQLRRQATLYLVATFGGTCELCETQIDPDLPVGHPARVQLDHIVPTSLGGLDTWGNVRVAHGTCNSIREDGALELSPEWAKQWLAAETRRWAGVSTWLDSNILRLAHAAEATTHWETELTRANLASVPDDEYLDELESKLMLWRAARDNLVAYVQLLKSRPELGRKSGSGAAHSTA